MKKIDLEILAEKLNKNKAIPIYKKKITKSDLEKIFTKQELKKIPIWKEFTFYFGLISCITSVIALNLVGIFVAVTFMAFSFFMKDSKKKFLEQRIKNDQDKLVSAYEAGLLDFHLYDGIGRISRSDTEIVS